MHAWMHGIYNVMHCFRRAFIVILLIILAASSYTFSNYFNSSSLVALLLVVTLFCLLFVSLIFAESLSVVLDCLSKRCFLHWQRTLTCSIVLKFLLSADTTLQRMTEHTFTWIWAQSQDLWDFACLTHCLCDHVVSSAPWLACTSSSHAYQCTPMCLSIGDVASWQWMLIK
jgi:hypothetical protein